MPHGAAPVQTALSCRAFVPAATVAVFLHAQSFNLNITLWDTSRVTTMALSACRLLPYSAMPRLQRAHGRIAFQQGS